MTYFCAVDSLTIKKKTKTEKKSETFKTLVHSQVKSHKVFDGKIWIKSH